MIVALSKGCSFAFAADLAQGLEGARDADLAGFETPGHGLRWPSADVALPDLMAGLLGTVS